MSFTTVERKDVSALQTLLFGSAQGKSMKISYEVNSYKKVSGDKFYVIPRGKKCITWFTMYKNAPEVLFFDLDPRDHSKVKFVSIRKIHPICVAVSLFQGAGTVIYGTLFAHAERQLFSVENIHVYRNACVDHLSVREKDALIHEIFANEGLGNTPIPSQPSNTSGDYVWFGIAVKYNTYAQALHSANTPAEIPYSVYAIQARYHTQTDNKYYQNCQNQSMNDTTKPTFGNFNTGSISSSTSASSNAVQPRQQQQQQQQPQQQPQQQQQQHQYQYQYQQPSTKVFLVSPEPRVDVYTLRCPVTRAVEPELAHIGDYKTSVMMNTLFRNVRENASLDAIEESDDEDAFQNSQIRQMNGYIKSGDSNPTPTPVELAMVCTYNYKFKRWSPLKPVS